VGEFIQLSNSLEFHQGRLMKRDDVFSHNLELFPLDVLSIDPTRKGADSTGLVTAIDGYPYTAKSARTRRDLPLNEWLCYQLAEACGIAVPTNKILRMPDDELVFGSRWVGGTYTQTGSVNTPDQLVRRLFAPERLWAILAFDLFIHNLDRRIANLLFLPVDGKTNVLAIDFSRALLHHPAPFPPLSHIPNDCNTLLLARWVNTMVRPSFGECERVLNALDQVKAAHLMEWSRRTPEAWRSITQLNELLVWWESEHKSARLQEIKDGLWNGSLI
jgi:hypothetical protein